MSARVKDETKIASKGILYTIDVFRMLGYLFIACCAFISIHTERSEL